VKKILIFIVVLIATSLISGVAYSKAKGTISGQVTNLSGNGVANVFVDAFDFLYDNWTGGSSTDSDGYYSLSLPVGAYKVRFTPLPSGGFYAPEWYESRNSAEVADFITVTAFRVTPNINAQLAIGGTISGRVTETSGNGIPNVSVNVIDLNDTWVISASTDSNGSYIFNVPAATYKVYFSPSPSNGFNAPAWYYDKKYFQEADLVTIPAGKITSNVNAQLKIGGRISGRVTEPSGNKSIAYVHVNASDPIYGWTSGTSTDSDGKYSFNVPVGTFKVGFYPLPPIGSGFGYYAPEWYENKSYFQAADLVTVAAQTISDIGARLEIGGSIAGRVTDSSRNPIPGVYVQAYDPKDENIVFNGSTTNTKGFYTILLAAGNYKVLFSPRIDGENYASEWYNNKSDFHSADTVTVRRFMKSIINMSLEP
jgi:hypothetical protein